MRLNRLFIEHFKGIRKLEIEPKGKNVVIRGENGTGKTSVADAIAWVFTGKGADGSQIDGQIKLRNERGECQNDGGIEHKVEAELENDDGEPVKISRCYVEKWAKRRGDNESEFVGNTVKYAINDVPLSKTEFEKRLSKICDEDTFRLLSMPFSFCSMKWQERRRTLMAIVGSIGYEDVIDKNPELEPLRGKLKDKSIDDLRKILKAQITKTNDSMKGIPARIDELTMMQSAVVDEPRENIEKAITSMRSDKEKAETSLINLKEGGAISQKRMAITSLETEANNFRSQFESDYNRKISESKLTINGCRSEIERLGREIERAQKQIERYKTSADTQDGIAANLRKRWAEVQKDAFSLESVDDKCPYCGQKLPDDKVEELRAKAVEKFNLEKAKLLKEINEKGKRIMADKNRDIENAAELEHEVQEKQGRIEQLSKSLAEAEKLMDGQEKPDVEKEPEYIEKLEKITALNAEIEALLKDNSGEIEKLETEIAEIDEKLAAEREKLAAIKQTEAMKERVDELKDEEKSLGILYNNLQKEMALTDAFIEAEVNMTESGINSHFKFVRWKMFDRQINGGLRPCCEPLIDGVPFWDGLNKGNRMKAALDILNTLGKYYKKTLPVIIDDCESYTSLIPIDSQVIRLIADKNYKSLNVEVDEK